MSADAAAGIKAPLLALYAELDTRLSRDGQPSMPRSPRYDEAAAKLARQRTLDWLNKYLSG